MSKQRRPEVHVRSLDVEAMTHFDATRTFTTVTLRGERYVGVGSAKRNPADEHDGQTGQDIALARALRELADALEDGAHERDEPPREFTYTPGTVTITPWR